MNRIILILLLFTTISFATISNSKYLESDLKTLKQLHINPSFLEDKLLINTFNEYSLKSNLSKSIRILKNSSLYSEKIKEEFRTKNIPESVFFIPMLESHFVNHSNGKNKPAGLWQIMPQTAKTLGLRNDDFIDERLDYIKATQTATKYLGTYYKKFGKWHLAILAYNSGEGRVLEAVTRASFDEYIKQNPSKKNDKKTLAYKKIIDDYLRTKKNYESLNVVYKELKSMKIDVPLENLIKIDSDAKKNYLSKTTSLYLRKIVVLSMLSNRNFYQKNDFLKSNNSLERVTAPQALQLKSIAAAINISSKELANMNKHIKKQVLPKDSKRYVIYIPKNKLEIYNKKIGSINPPNLKKTGDKN